MNVHEPNEIENAFDQRMQAALRGLKAPEEGMHELLKMLGDANQPATVVKHDFSMTRRTWLKAAAAAIVVVGGGGILVQRRLRAFGSDADAATPDGFITSAVRKATQMINLRYKNSNWEGLAKAQKELGVPFSAQVPSKLADLEAKGCQDYEWKGSRVGLSCFVSQDGALMHIFSVPATGFATPPTTPASLSAVKRQLERDHFCWGEPDTFHVLVASKPETKLAAIRDRFLA